VGAGSELGKTEWYVLQSEGRRAVSSACRSELSLSASLLYITAEGM